MLLPSIANDFGRTSHKKARPILARADTLPSPPATAKADRLKPITTGPASSAEAALASPPASSDVEMDSPVQEARTLARGRSLVTGQPGYDFESPIQARTARREQRVERRVTPSPPPPAAPRPSHLKDGPSNPFRVQEGEERRLPKKVSRPKPDCVTYVFRGKKIKYDVPFDALMAPEDPCDSPFPNPSPRLLFPPQPVTPPASTSSNSSFLDRLRQVEAGDPIKPIEHGLPTPAQESSKNKKRSRDSEASGSSKMFKTNAFQRMNAEERAAGRLENRIDEEVEVQQLGLM